MPTTDEIWNEAIQEAYASAPTDEVILHTLELRHPAFLASADINAVRVVMDYSELLIEGEGDEPDIYGHYLTLEDNAPLEAAQSVMFISCMFDFKIPEQSEGSLPTVEIELNNVSKILMPHLEAAIGIRNELEVTYREYLATDKTNPAYILSNLTMKRIVANNTKVTGTAQFMDLHNRSFPNKVYRPEVFRGLAQ